MKFTAKTVAALKLPAGRSETIYFDDTLPGFGLRLRAGGARTWIYQYKLGDKHRRVTLGSEAALVLSKARDQSVRLYAQVKLGQDPAGQKQEGRARALQTFEAVLDGFLRAQRRRLKQRSYTECERYLLRYFKPFHGLPIGSINRQAISARISAIATDNGPVAADRARSWLSSFYSWAMRDGLTEANPVIGSNRPSESKPRDRVLSDDELADIWHALGEGRFADIVQLLILTALRRNEVGDLRWSEIDTANAVLRLPVDRVKNGIPHTVQLSDTALDIIKAQPKRLHRDLLFGEAQRGFNGWGHCKDRLDRRIANARKASKAKPMPPWVLHDIRRTVATRLGDLGVQPHVVEAVLNHQSGTKRGVAGVYNKSPYERETKTAMALWADQVRSIVEKCERKVLKFPENRS
jgi:integrase